MKRIIRSALMAMALVGASYGVADAYMYGITDYNPTTYPLVLTDGMNLCYTMMGTGVYMLEKTAHIVSQEGSVYTLSATFAKYYQDKKKLIPMEVTYKYDTSTHTVYYTSEGKDWAFGPHNENTSQATYRGMAAAKQIWHSAIGTEWEW